jgi:hypothetical protein
MVRTVGVEFPAWMFFLLLPTLYFAFRREAQAAPSSSPPAVQRTLTLTKRPWNCAAAGRTLI